MYYRIKTRESNIIFDGQYMTMERAEHHISLYKKMDVRNGLYYTYAIVDESGKELKVIK